MRKRLPTLVAMLALVGAKPALAQGLIEPEWRVVNEEGLCVVIGALSDGTVTELRLVVPFDERATSGFSVFLPEDSSEAPADAMLGVNGHPPLNVELSWTAYGKAPNAFFDLDDRPELGDALRTGTPGVLRIGGEVFSLQNLSKPMKEGRECVRSIFAQAGIEIDDYPGVRELRRVDPKELGRSFRLGRHTAKMENSILGLFTASDYPTAALRNGEQGAVRAALMIDEKGRVENCVVLVSAGERLDDATCRILKSRGRFSPTVEDDGRPVGSVFVTPPIRWSLPFYKE